MKHPFDRFGFRKAHLRRKEQESMKLCQAIIWLTHTSNTYCMREMGHAGKCSADGKEPEVDTKAKETKEKK